MMICRKRSLLFILFLALMAVWFCFIRAGEKIGLEEQGDRKFAIKEYAQSIYAWKEVLKDKPENIQILKKLEKAYLGLGMIARAQEILTKALVIAPGDYDLHMELVRINLLKGDIAAAEKRCFMLKGKIPKDPQLNLLMGDLFMLYRQNEKAELFYRKALLSMQASPRPLLKLATCLMVMGREKEADNYFCIAERQKDKTSLTLIQFSDFFLVSEEYEKAGQYLLLAVNQEPEDFSLKIRLAEFYMAMDNLLKAEKVLKELVDSVKINIDLKKMLADVYLSLNKMDSAEKILRVIGDAAGKQDIEYELLSGKYWLLKGNTAYAATHLKSAVDIMPFLSSVHYFLGIAYLAGGQSQLAENSVEKALFFEPEYSKAELLKAGILYKKGKNTLSLKYLNQLIKKEPENYRAHILKGLNLVSLKEYSRAAMEFASSFTIDPENISSLYFLGVAAELSGHETEALHYYKKILTANSDLADVSYRYAMLLIKTKEEQKAEDFINLGIEKNPENPYLYHIAAKVALKNSKPDMAENYLKKALSQKQVPGIIYLTLARLYDDQGDIEKSVEIIKKCTNNLPLYKHGWIRFAGHYLKLGKIADALGIMKKAEKKLPESPEILSNLAWLYLETDSDFDLALDFARKAYEKAPGNNSVADTLGWAYYKKKAYTQAQWVLSEVLAKDTDNGMVLYHYGMTLYRQGKIAKAAETLRQALGKDLPEGDIKKIKKILSELNREVHDTRLQLDESSDIKDKAPFSINSKEDDDILKPQWQNSEKF